MSFDKPDRSSSQENRSKKKAGRATTHAQDIRRFLGTFTRCISSAVVDLPPMPTVQVDSTKANVNGKTSTSVNSLANVPPVSPTTSFPEIYLRCIAGLQYGYPLYDPEPGLSLTRKKGIEIGDVGLVTRDGSFHILFNVCDQYKNTNPPTLPDNFETIEEVEMATRAHFPPETTLFSHSVQQKKISDILYTYCCAEEGVILELPEGATLFEAKNVKTFHDLARRHADSWLKYAPMNRPRADSNPSLHLVIGCIKTKVWGIAVFDKPSTSKDYLQFTIDETVPDKASPLRYGWKGSGSVSCKIGPKEPGSGDENQCIFLLSLTVGGTD